MAPPSLAPEWMLILDDSHAAAERPMLGKSFHGLEINLRSFGGARSARVVHSGGQSIEEHHHDWACLTLHILGEAEEHYDGGQVALNGPSAVFHPVRAPHVDAVAEVGLETVSIQFDPAWVTRTGFPLATERTLAWRGGKIGAAARRLSGAWCDPRLSETALADETLRFLKLALNAEAPHLPTWVGNLRKRLCPLAPVQTQALAEREGLDLVRLARSYQVAFGEGLQETIRRKRVAAACSLLRSSDQPLAEIAVAAGFCDQSHMNRNFRSFLGRTPLQVRRERKLLVHSCSS